MAQTDPVFDSFNQADRRVFQLRALVDLMSAADIHHLKNDTLVDVSTLMDELLAEANNLMNVVARQAFESKIGARPRL